jgi:protein-disulfide isomerase
VPVAIAGVLFFALVLLIAGVAGRAGSPARETAPAYTFALSTIGLAMVLYLGWASYFVLKTFCILCGITYVSVIAIFIVSGGATSFPMTTLPSRAQRDLRTLATSPLALVLTLLFAVLAVSAFTMFPRDAAAGGQSASAAPAPLPAVTEEDRANLAKWWDVQPKSELPIPADGAKVLIVKFNDYQCPACKATYDAYKGILAKYVASGEVKYVTKHFPLEAECNPYAAMNHYASCEASAAIIMSRSKGTTAKLEEWVFAHIGPPMLTADEVKDAARTVGGITDFAAQYPRALEEIKTDAGLGNLLKVSSTPTFFINGRKPGILAPQYFDALIQLELQRSK